ncbi:MAG: DUF4149 domain-containing protein [Thermodesulfobacteriota bacterium]|nr:MAG: DUF4149 domain-containing protein [Thermodesulfobacteriota bacterium]
MILQAALLLHILAAIFWVGGMLFLVIVIAPYLKSVPDPKAKSQIYQVVGKKYRFWGWVAIVTLLVTGPVMLYYLWAIPPSGIIDPALHSTGFGQALAAKLALVALIVISSLVHDFWLGPRARSSPGYSRLAKIFGRTNLIIALLIVLFATYLRTGGF